jgi:hypothetical protein
LSSREVKGPGINAIRAIVRPLWGIIGALSFGFECFTIGFSWWVKIFEETEIPVLSFPGPVHILLMIIAGFYFGGRIYEKQGKLFEKFGI